MVAGSDELVLTIADTTLLIMEPTSKLPQSQDPKSARSQAEASRESQESSWSPNQMLSTHMDVAGHPVPDEVTDTSKDKKSKDPDDDADVFEAMTADFD